MTEKPKYTPEDMARDAAYYGTAWAVTRADGTFERIEPHEFTSEHLASIEANGWGIGRLQKVALSEALKKYPPTTR
jgi:hypothetical protein